MKKLLILLILSMLISTSAPAADVELQLTIKDIGANLANYDRMVQKVERIPNDADGNPLFTVDEWRKQWLPRFIRRQMERFKNEQSRNSIVKHQVPITDVTVR